jgi:hypothetical protein
MSVCLRVLHRELQHSGRAWRARRSGARARAGPPASVITVLQSQSMFERPTGGGAMDTATLIDSLASHVGVMQAIYKWTLVLALAAGWAGLRSKEQVSIAGISFGRRDAFRVLSGLYFVATLGFLVALLRIEAILRLLADDAFVRGYSKLATHSWILNPFGYLGTAWPAAFGSAAGIGVLILSWWVCLASVFMLRDEEPPKAIIVRSLPFYLAGLLALYLLQRIYAINFFRLTTLAPAVAEGLEVTRWARWAAIGLSLLIIAVGSVAVYRRPGPGARIRLAIPE